MRTGSPISSTITTVPPIARCTSFIRIMGQLSAFVGHLAVSNSRSGLDGYYGGKRLFLVGRRVL